MYAADRLVCLSNDYVNRIQPAVEGYIGIGNHITMRLLAAGEQIVDVPPKLSAGARIFTTGQDKTDATYPHFVAWSAPDGRAAAGGRRRAAASVSFSQSAYREVRGRAGYSTPVRCAIGFSCRAPKAGILCIKAQNANTKAFLASSSGNVGTTPLCTVALRL
ncbi:hypothetical protein [Micromonospora sp. M61]|uniref:hypothetical protein n=1 Tax=Micromonospora sp. M61 TaxID=2824890 RepID=UPI001B39A8EC|nr:hypothetical protein [Micromonospora sp. M61]MBQ0982567.1 hypothetical protein [Micromonospora sp. M61]